MDNPRCIAATHDFCGEGALWHPREGVVYWTDINRFLIHRYDPRTQAVNTWHFDQPVTALALSENMDRLVVVLGGAVIVWDPHNDDRSIHLYTLAHWPALRCNDARVSPLGSLWIGTMQNNVATDGGTLPVTEPSGQLSRLRGDGEMLAFDSGFYIPNTVVWDSGANSLLCGDTLRNTIYRYPYSGDDRVASHRSVFFSGFSRGLPDGSAMDCEGFLWNCRYGGACLVRIAPDGSVDTVLEMPVKNPTTCAFGGEDLRTLFITSAGEGKSIDRESGGLFAVRLPVSGLELPRFQSSNRTGSDASKPPSTR